MFSRILNSESTSFLTIFLLLFIFYWQTEEVTCFRPIRNLLLFQLLKRDKIGEGNWRKPLLNSLLIFMKILFVEIESSDLYDCKCNVHIALNAIKLAFKNNFVRMAKKGKRQKIKCMVPRTAMCVSLCILHFGQPVQISSYNVSRECIIVLQSCACEISKGCLIKESSK